jgi:hypothetical protein
MGMIGIIKTILCESSFSVGEIFNIEINQQKYEFQSLVSEQNPSQVYLIMPIVESKLLEINLFDILPDIAAAFKETKLYEAEMEKNTSLVVCVNKDIDSGKLTKEAIAIEDNPYYFKKYLFTYHSDDNKKFEQLKKEYECKQNIEFIQKYVTNSKNFETFKENPTNNDAYKLISDLLVKVPVISIEFSNDESLYTVERFFEEEEIYKKQEKLDHIIDIVNSTDEKTLENLANEILKIWDQGLVEEVK